MGHSEIPLVISTGRDVKKRAVVRVMVNNSPTPDGKAQLVELHHVAHIIADKPHVGVIRGRVVLMVDRVAGKTVVIAGDHHHRAIKARELLVSEVERRLFHPVMVKQVSRDQQQVHTPLDCFVYNPTQTELRSTLIVAGPNTVIEVHVRCVQYPDLFPRHQLPILNKRSKHHKFNPSPNVSTKGFRF